MKSVGEVMAIGRKFEEAVQKALRMRDIGACGLVANQGFQHSDLDSELSQPTSERALAIPEAIKKATPSNEFASCRILTDGFFTKSKISFGLRRNWPKPVQRWTPNL